MSTQSVDSPLREPRRNSDSLARKGRFVMAIGSMRAMGEFHLATDTWNTRFAEQIGVPDELRSLPNAAGSGNLRALQQAAALSSALTNLLELFQNAARVETYSES